VPALSYGSAHSPQLKYYGTASIPPLFSSPFIICTHHHQTRRIFCYSRRRQHPRRRRASTPLSSPTSYSSRLTIIHAAGIFTAILIGIVLVASYAQLPTASVPLRAVLTISQSLPIFSPRLICDRPCCKLSVVYRYTLDVMNRTGLSHYTWNQMRV